MIFCAFSMKVMETLWMSENWNKCQRIFLWKSERDSILGKIFLVLFLHFQFFTTFSGIHSIFFVVFDFNSFHLLKSLMDLLIFVLKASCLEKVYTSKYFALCYMFAGLSLCNEMWNWNFFLFSIVSFVVHKIVIFVIFV